MLSPEELDLAISVFGDDDFVMVASESQNATVTVPAGGYIYFKGTMSKCPTFVGSQNHNVGGNLLSVTNDTNFTTISSSTNAYLGSAFYGDTNLISSSDLELTADGTCSGFYYGHMFEDCWYMQNTPSLPATNLTPQC